MTTHGPYTTREQAVADAEPVYAALRAVDPGGPMTGEIRAQRHAVRVTAIDNALHAAGVELGAYDGDIADWLATWEPETVQVILGWIERANTGVEAERLRTALQQGSTLLRGTLDNPDDGNRHYTLEEIDRVLTEAAAR